MRSTRPRIVALATALLFVGGPAPACPTHHVEAAGAAGEGKPVEATALLDTPFVKLVQIKLRNGAELADHSVPEAITLQATVGSATLTVGAVTERLTPGAVVLVAPGAKHRIVPDGKEGTVLLVHILRMAGKAATGDAATAPGSHEHAH